MANRFMGVDVVVINGERVHPDASLAVYTRLRLASSAFSRRLSQPPKMCADV